MIIPILVQIRVISSAVSSSIIDTTPDDWPEVQMQLPMRDTIHSTSPTFRALVYM
ncbi:MAG: hypothetical protein R3E21_00845 [Caenibius sp.]